MKKYLLAVIAILNFIIANAQSNKIVCYSAIRNEVIKAPSNSAAHSNNCGLKHMIYNVTANYQKIIKGDTSIKIVYAPIILVNNKLVEYNKIDSVVCSRITNFEFNVGIRMEALYGTSSRNGVFIISTE